MPFTAIADLGNDLQRRLAEHLERKGITPTCELCQHSDWASLPKPVSMPLTDFEGDLVGGKVVCAAMVCKNCGHMRMFALGRGGVFAPTSPKV